MKYGLPLVQVVSIYPKNIKELGSFLACRKLALSVLCGSYILFDLCSITGVGKFENIYLKLALASFIAQFMSLDCELLISIGDFIDRSSQSHGIFRHL